MPAIACAIVALLFLAAPGFAHAQGSEVDQYVPYVPDSEGKERVGGGGGEPLPPETAKELAALGPEGEAVAELAQGSPAADTGDGAGKDGGAGERPSPTSAVIESDSDGLGIVLPLLLVIALAIAGAYAVHRRRAGG